MDPEKSRFLSKVTDDVEAQRAWLAEYRSREESGSEYYFVVEDAKSLEAMGVVRVYDVAAGAFEWGSWIMKDGAPPSSAIESALGVYEFAFGHLGLQASRFKVFKVNERVVEFHRRFGARETGEDEENVYFELTAEAYQLARKRFRRFLAEV
jgi:RimJ/RimL family protein N-acetyltransferase